MPTFNFKEHPPIVAEGTRPLAPRFDLFTANVVNSIRKNQMNHLYTKACISPIKLAAHMKAAISLLEPLMQASEAHSTEDKDMRDLLSKMQWELDQALKVQMYEVQAQLGGGLITFEEFANHLVRTMAIFNAMYTDIKEATNG